VKSPHETTFHGEMWWSFLKLLEDKPMLLWGGGIGFTFKVEKL